MRIDLIKFFFQLALISRCVNISKLFLPLISDLRALWPTEKIRRDKNLIVMATQINSGSVELDKKIEQWLQWDKVNNYGEPCAILSVCFGF